RRARARDRGRTRRRCRRRRRACQSACRRCRRPASAPGRRRCCGRRRSSRSKAPGAATSRRRRPRGRRRSCAASAPRRCATAAAAGGRPRRWALRRVRSTAGTAANRHTARPPRHAGRRRRPRAGGRRSGRRARTASPSRQTASPPRRRSARARRRDPAAASSTRGRSAASWRGGPGGRRGRRWRRRSPCRVRTAAAPPRPGARRGPSPTPARPPPVPRPGRRSPATRRGGPSNENSRPARDPWSPAGIRATLACWSAVRARTCAWEARRSCGAAALILLFHRAMPLPSIGAAPAASKPYRYFFIAGIAVVLTVGAAWGAWLLLQIAAAGRFTGASLFQVNAHGHAQVFGWVGLFVMGFGYQMFPALWQRRLLAPRLVPAVFAAMIAGIVIRTVAMAAVGARWAVPAVVAGGTLEIAAIAAFAVQLGLTWRASFARQQPYLRYVGAALAFFVAQAIFCVWHTLN